MHYQKEKLKNGLEVLFIDNPGATAGSVQVWFRAGSALEKKEDFGIAHFLEHMFFKGTKKRPGSAIAHEVESFGGELNAFTSFDYTCYYINTPNSYLKNTVDILLDMVSNPQFKTDDIVPERGVVFEEYRRSIDNPGQFSFHRLQKNSFTGGYAHPILGNEKTIKSFNRNQLIKFRKAFYNKSNCMLVVAGDINKKKTALTKLIEKYKMPGGSPTSFPSFSLKKKSSIEVHQKDVRMAQLTLTIQAPDYKDKEAAAEDLAVNCMGHGESSKLFKNLVLDGSLCSTSSASTMFLNKGGAHFARMSFPYENIDDVLQKLKETIDDVVVNGFSQSEVNRIKNQYVASKVYEMESLESFAFSLGHGFAQTGDINCEEEFIAKIKATSTNTVNLNAKKIFQRPMHLSLQIPLENDVKKTQSKLEKFLSSLEDSKKSHDPKSLPASAITRSKYDPQVKHLKLKRGISLLYRKNDMNPTFVLHAYMKGGLTEETKKSNGIHHILAGLLTKGYDGIPYDEIKSSLEDRSATLNSFAGKNAYGLICHGQTEHFHDLINHFEGALLRADMNQPKLDHEKEMTLRSIQNHKKDPIKTCFRAVNEVHFQDHPYAFSMLGTEENIEKFSREEVLEFHQKNVETKEIMFTYCGDLELEEVLTALNPIISKLKPREERKLSEKKFLPKLGEYKFIPFDREQTQIFVGVPAPKLGSKDNLYLKMITTHLSGQSSELFVEVRDRQGLCYSAQPVHFTALEGGYWGIYMASGHDKVDAAVAAIKGILTNLRDNGLSKSEFSRIKKMIEGQSLLNVQTNDDYANIYSVTTLQGHGLDFYHLNNLAVSKMSYEVFQKSINRLLSKEWNTILVGRSE